MWGLSRPGSPLELVDLSVPKQECTAVETEFTEEGLIEHFHHCVDDLGMESASQFQRVWLHTHPGNSATPSGQDWQTFNGHLFNSQDYSVMYIIARGGAMTCHVRVNAGGISLVQEVQTYIDYDCLYPGVSDEVISQWEDEYANVTESTYTPSVYQWANGGSQGAATRYYDLPDKRYGEILDDMLASLQTETLYQSSDVEITYLMDNNRDLTSAYRRRKVFEEQKRRLGIHAGTFNYGPGEEESQLICHHLGCSRLDDLDDLDLKYIREYMGWWPVDINRAAKRMADNMTVDTPLIEWSEDEIFDY